MNELLEQFLIESKELVEQATEGLLVLEGAPDDVQRLDAVFRAFHTLKGSAGIVDFAAMERAVHGAEDLLAEARAGRRRLTPAVVGVCLNCLDLLVQWLDAMAATGEVPAGAEAQAQQLLARAHASIGAGPDPAPPAGAVSSWLDALLVRHAASRAQARTAIHFVPEADSFFRGEDPVARMLSLPHLLAFDAAPLAPWPPPDQFDPYQSNLVLTALSAATAAEVAAHFAGHSGSCAIESIGTPGPAPEEAPLPSLALDLLRAQRAMLGESVPAEFAGRVAAAGRAAQCVLRSAGMAAQAELISQATARSLRERDHEVLVQAITLALAGTAPPTPPAATALPAAEPARRTLRVDAERIDALVRLTGELTTAMNAAGHVLKVAQETGSTLAAPLKLNQAALAHLVQELQRAVLGMRVLPLRSVLQRFPRVLRDLSASLGKPVMLHIEGEETEADKAIVEMLFEPLLHVLRNALDHGIESPALRQARGKPATAHILIRAARRNDQVWIEISDDGGGIDVERVRAVAAQRGVASEAALLVMPDADLIDLIFAPGFSTAGEITGLSGRGVGMDAVRSAVSSIGGRVNVESVAGQGTTVRFLLPFSIMMTAVMVVEAGGQMFGIPLDAVVETVRVAPQSIARIGQASAIVLREQTIPVLQLGALLGIGSGTAPGEDATLVIATFAGQLSAIQVDRIGERMQVILKPLDGLLAGMPGLSGTTLAGDGRVLLVLDIGGLVL
ncbi:MAG: chemotaxis protein CheA [Steroidobacteraceae bacterium]